LHSESENKIPEVVSSGTTVKRKCGKDKILSNVPLYLLLGKE
jgi:hypothetical protein